MKKILFLIHDLSVGGAEKVLVNLVNNMDYTKFDVTVIALFGGGTNEKFLNKNVHYKYIFKKVFPANSKIMKFFSPSLLHKLFVKEKYDYEISYLEGPSARIISGCRDKSVKLITWIHTIQATKKKAAVSFRNYSESEKCYGRFDKVVCVSENIKEDFLNLYPNTKSVEVLYNTNETKKMKINNLKVRFYTGLYFFAVFLMKIWDYPPPPVMWWFFDAKKPNLSHFHEKNFFKSVRFCLRFCYNWITMWL